MKKICLDCQSPLKGRSDKKFCSDYCRNNYNNRRNSFSNNYARRVNHILRRNRHILQELYLSKQLKTSMHTLLEHGFCFSYFTHQQTGTDGKVSCYCYDYGYRLLKNDQYQLLRSPSVQRRISLHHHEQD